MKWIILEIKIFGIGNQGVEDMRLFRDSDSEGHFTPAIYAVFFFSFFFMASSVAGLYLFF